MALVALWTVACGAGASSPGSSTAPVSTTVTAPSADADWPTYHHDAARSGVSSDQQALGSVKAAWTSASLDGAIYAEPLVVGGKVIVATEGNSVYALDAVSGQTVWTASFGAPVPGGALPCGNIDPSGITGTPVVNVAGGTIYAVAFLKASMQHELFDLDLQTGSVRWHRPIDPPGLSPLVEQERGALTLVGGRVYVPFGGLYGDCGQYKGAVVSVAADGTGNLASYIVPTNRMAGIWNPAGPVVDANGDLWVTTGNSQSQSTFDYGNSAIKLSPQLQVIDYFAPSDWKDLNAGDVDLGSTSPVILGPGFVAQGGKDGIIRLLSRKRLQGAAPHKDGELQTVRTPSGTDLFTAPAVWHSTSTWMFAGDNGGTAGYVFKSGHLRVAWHNGTGGTSPVVAGGLLWVYSPGGGLNVYRPTTGALVTRLDAGSGHWNSPIVADGRVALPEGNANDHATTGVLDVWRLP